ncbi:hypothetical protein Rumeso_04168 [Rubellimicrobium mesophilum DSM 19309]|uniref:Uncharacterized protein n=1 Tax=Rubellimicrobium mesophilum DSM 19309 TaxID=442562 RepID=A0A017HKJ8_9RHOB|nr:hypothetical protein Rumeso_04168 [Rubellimicrobium mesophilum DSM 19309]
MEHGQSPDDRMVRADVLILPDRPAMAGPGIAPLLTPALEAPT